MEKEKIKEVINNKNTTNGGVSLFTVLGIIFVVLKLVGVISWPWVWVLAPFWIPLAIVLALVCIFLLVMLIVAIVQHIIER